MDQILNVRNKVILSHVMQPSQANLQATSMAERS